MVGTYPAVQWLRLRASTAGGMGWIPGQGTRISHVAQRDQKKKKKKNQKWYHNMQAFHLIFYS